jgi:3-phosphoglycerate kinase
MAGNERRSKPISINDYGNSMIKYLSITAPQKLHGTALLRLDFNTEDDWRMQAVLPTIKFLLKKNCKIIVVSHKGRPNGFDKKLSLKKNAVHLTRLLGGKNIVGKKVRFIGHFIFNDIKKEIDHAQPRSVFLLENLRFIKGEEKNDPAFARQLASLAHFYVNDAFAVSHRANASVVAITKYLPSYAGFELESEIKSLGQAMLKPKRPLVLILGGAKAADKLGVIKFFKNKADWFLLGGGPANTILALKGMDIKKSVRDNDPKSVRELKKLIASHNVFKRIVLPNNFVWQGAAIRDLGPKSIGLFAKKIAAAGTVLWSGPMGLIEKKQYTKGSVALAKTITKNRKAFSIAGGGETVMFLKKYKLDKKFSFISTGGGAMIDFLAGKKLPGITALEHP